LGLLSFAALVAASGGCNKEWDAAQGQAALKRAGFTVGESTPDPSAGAVNGVQDGQCFAVSRATQTARVCVWRCATAPDCIAVPPQKVWLHGTFGRSNAYVDTQDESFGHEVLTALHP
jgi:hypothetical protein